MFSLHKIEIDQLVLLMLQDKDVIAQREEHTHEILSRDQQCHEKRTQSYNAG